MKTTRTTALGLAMCLMAVGGAEAADLPVKAKAVEYVRICSLYGAGFWYIPGTDTCMKIGGYLRVDTTFNGGIQGNPYWNGNGGLETRYKDYFQSRSRLMLDVDTRTATEYGVVRTYGQARFQFNDPDGTAPFSGFPNPTGASFATSYLFIQFAGFTFGKSASAYATPWQGYPGNMTDFLLGGQNTDTGVNNIQYTAQFGNGVSGTIGLESPAFWDRTQVYNTTFVGINALGTSSSAYANVHSPDINGNIRIDQAWGLFQISAAAHEVSGSYNILTPATAAPTTLSEISGHPDAKWGGSVMAALQIKNIPTGPGDDIKMDASFAKGHTKNVIASASSSPSFAMIGNSGVAYQSIGLGATSDAVYSPGLAGNDGALKLTEAWGIRGAFNHNWDPYWSTSLFGSYSSVRYSGSALDLSTAKGAYCAAFAVSHPGQNVTYSCDPNFNVAQLGVVTRWTPVKNLTFSGEVMWSHLDQKMAGVSVFSPGAPKPTTAYEFKDQDTVELQLRAQRNF